MVDGIKNLHYACSMDSTCSGVHATDLPNEANQGLLQMIGR